MANVETLHLLVHPGFGMEAKKLKEPRHVELFHRYEESATTMKSNDAMIVFPMFPLHYWKQSNPIAGEMIGFMERIKDILAERCTIMPAPQIDFSSAKFFQNLDKALSVLEERGLSVSRETQSKAYGETWGTCVPTVAQDVNIACQLKDKTVVETHRTNLGVRDNETPREEAERFMILGVADRAVHEVRQKFDRLRFDFSVPGFTLSSDF